MTTKRAAMRVTVRTIPCVYVAIEGEPHPAGFPYLPRDDGKIHAFTALNSAYAKLNSARGKKERKT